MTSERKPGTVIQGEAIELVPAENFNFRQRAERERQRRDRATGGRKLPPVPGRSPRADEVPPDEELPRRR